MAVREAVPCINNNYYFDIKRFQIDLLEIIQPHCSNKCDSVANSNAVFSQCLMAQVLHCLNMSITINTKIIMVLLN